MSEQSYVMYGNKMCLKEETNLFIVRPAPKHMGHCCLTSAANLEGDRIESTPRPPSTMLSCPPLHLNPWLAGYLHKHISSVTGFYPQTINRRNGKRSRPVLRLEPSPPLSGENIACWCSVFWWLFLIPLTGIERWPASVTPGQGLLFKKNLVTEVVWHVRKEIQKATRWRKIACTKSKKVCQKVEKAPSVAVQGRQLHQKKDWNDLGWGTWGSLHSLNQGLVEHRNKYQRDGSINMSPIRRV